MPRLIKLTGSFDDGTDAVLWKELGAPEQPPPEPQLPPLSNRSRVGVNLELPNSNSTCHVFADALKSARPLGVATDADKRVVFVQQVAAEGVYTQVTRDGQQFAFTVPPGQSSLTLGSDTVALYRPGCNPGDLFTPQFLDLLKPFGCIRFMDPGQTNGSRIVHPSDMPTEASETWERPGYGVPVSVMVKLCNQTQKDGWFNIPHAATDETVRAYASEIAKLDQRLNAYIEYGNELVWNFAPPFNVARDYIMEKVRGELAAGTEARFREPNNNSWNEVNAAHRWVAERLHQIAQIFGDSGCRFVLSNQNGFGQKPNEYGHWFKHQLSFLQRQGLGTLWLYAIASAPYGSVNGTNPKPDHRAAIKAIADQYGLKYLGYEIGFHDTDGGQAMRDAHTSDVAGAATEAYLNNLFDGGMEMGCWYTLSSRWTDKYVWGLADGFARGPKYQAAAKVAAERAR